MVQYQLYREPPIFKPIDRRQGRERLESFVFESSCEQDSGIGSHGATWAPANLGEQRISGSVSSRARSPCAHEEASGASIGNHAHGGRTSAEAGGGLDAVDSFYVNKKTLIWQQDSPKNSLVPPAVYEEGPRRPGLPRRGLRRRVRRRLGNEPPSPP